MSDDLAEAVQRITFERVTGEWALEGDLLDYGPLGFSISTQSYKVRPSTKIYRQVPLTAPTPVDWQPIETAPKDRIRVIGAHGDFVLGDIYFGEGSVLISRSGDPGYVRAQMERAWRYSRGGDKVADRHQPNYWQPLPDASRLSRPKPQ